MTSSVSLTRTTHPVTQSVRTLFSSPPYLYLALITSVTLLLAYLMLFVQTTTFTVFFITNSPFYNAASIILTVIVALLTGAAVSQTLYIFSLNRTRRPGVTRSAFGAGFGLLSAGCPSCASLLLPVLGIAGSLAVFPLGGLEIKLMATVILADAFWEGARILASSCPVSLPEASAVDGEGDVEPEAIAPLRPSRGRQLKTLGMLGVFTAALFVLPRLPAQYRVDFSTGAIPPPQLVQAPARGQDQPVRADQINPAEGFELPYTYGDIGPRLIEAGAIDVEAFKQVYIDAGNPLTEQQEQILLEGSDEHIVISRENAHFLLNLFWAFGLTNQNPILDEGPLVTNGQGSVTGYASTGGWILATRPIADLYSSTPIVSLTPAQQQHVAEAAEGTYRPCCNNSTAFADCNHGMAMLGLFELMASQGATTEELFEAAKYINAFWFPQQTFDVATYFKLTTGQDFAEVDGRTFVGPQFMSGQGWSTVRQWLKQNGQIEQVPGGGGCGV